MVKLNLKRMFGRVVVRGLVLTGFVFSEFVFSAPVVTSPVEVVHAEFGLFDTSNPRETLFEPSRVVPHRVGQRYGWVIDVRTSRRSLSVREEYLLANPVKTEAAQVADNTVVIPMERRNQVSQRQLVPQEGRIFGEWEIGPGEPAGRRHLQVVVEGEVAASYEYEVK